MANCAVCSAELKFSNTPLLGMGKLLSGEAICTSCFTKVHKASSKTLPSKVTLAEIRSILATGQEQSNNKQEKSNSIQAQLEKIGVTKSSSAALWGRKEISELPNIIADGEEMFALVQGRYNKAEGIVVATDRRLLFIEKGLLYGLRVEDFGLRTITSIQYNSGLLFADVTILANGNAEIITDVYKDAGRIFCDKVRAKLHELAQPVAAATTVIHHAAPVDVADQLQKLAGLKAQGILTQEEFDAQKKKLLGL